MPQNLGDDEEVLQHFNQSKRAVMQNRLLIVSSVNLLTFILSIFSISYYKWVWVEIINLSGKGLTQSTNQLWINLLYGKQDDNSAYQNFKSLSAQFCQSNDAACQAIFVQFSFVGYLVFFMFILAYILQLLDFYQVLRYVIYSKNDSQQSITFKHSLQVKDSFKHIITILSYLIGLGLNFFSLTLMNLSDYEYGVSFWIFFASLIIFILCVVYKNYEIRRIEQQSLVLNLIQGERNLRTDEASQERDGGSGQFQI